MSRGGDERTASEAAPPALSGLFPYRVRPGQDQVLRAVADATVRGGPLLIDAATGSGKTVAALAPLLEHAEAVDHRILYLVRTHAQEIQVLNEVRAISHRLEHPVMALGLQGRQRRCFLLEGLAEMRGATAEEHGKLCVDRRRATERAFGEGLPMVPAPELPDSGSLDLTDLDGCAYYARVLQADLESLTERFAQRLPSPQEFERYCREENFCPYELSKRLARLARVVTAPYAFFFHPRIRIALLGWLGVDLSRIDLVVDEAHNLPEHLRELSTVALPQETVRRARAEIGERGDFSLPDGPGAGRFFEIVGAAIDELVDGYCRDEDGVLPPGAFEDALLAAIGGTSHRLDTWLGALATWGEAVREERRQQRRLPRSWVHAAALTLLSWPQLEGPTYAKVVMRSPRRALEAYALDARPVAAPILDCHLSVHLSGTLGPLEEYRDSLGLGENARLLSIPSPFSRENRRFFFDPTISTRYEEVMADPWAIPRIADRLGEIVQSLPVKTAIFFPSFELMEKVLAAGLHSALPAGAVVESRRLSMGDLWRSVEGFKKEPGGGVLLGVMGGRIAEGIDFPDEELEAVVVVGVPYPKPTAKREALREFFDRTTGHGWEYCVEAPAQRAILQAIGRMIRSEHDRGIAIVLDRRATQFAKALPGLEPLGDLASVAKAFYGRRPRWSSGPEDAPLPPNDAGLTGHNG